MSTPKYLQILIISSNCKEIYEFVKLLETYTHFPSKYSFSDTYMNANISCKYDLIIYLNQYSPIILDKNIVIWNPKFAFSKKIEEYISVYPYIHQISNYDDLSLLIGKIYLTSKLVQKEHNKNHLKITIPNNIYNIPETELKMVSTPIISVSTSSSSGRNSISPCMEDIKS